MPSYQPCWCTPRAWHALSGGLLGCAAGASATAVYATVKHWGIVIPSSGLAAGLGAAAAIGGLAGLLPAIRAARLDLTEALRTV